MGQTVVGFFKEAIDVQKAIQRLESKGISNQRVDVSKGRHPDGSVHSDGKTSNKITEFFNRLFGHESDDARLYSTVGQNDLHILTVHATTGDMAETAADVLDDCGAIDVDEYRGNYSERDRLNTGSHNTGQQEAASNSRTTYTSDRHHSFDSTEGRDKSLSARDDYANSLSTENLSAQVGDPTTIRDSQAGDRGPGMSNVNSAYVDERSYPDRSGPSRDGRRSADTDAHMQNPVEDSGQSNSSFGHLGSSQNDAYTGTGNADKRGSFTGEDMTNDRISSPDDDQRVIDQNNSLHERRNMISDEEAPGLENRIPTPLEQLNRAKRKSRIINASVEENQRLR